MAAAPSKPGVMENRQQEPRAGGAVVGTEGRDEPDSWASERDASETGPALE